MGLLARYANWLHEQWPAGAIEPLPQVNENGMSNIAGLYIVGDLTGVPLLKFSADTGARAVRHIAADANFQRARQQDNLDALDLAIVGAGVSGMSAALEARQAGLSFAIAEANEPFSTLINFPKGKPIYTYPTAMEPSGHLRFRASVREALIEEQEEENDKEDE